MNFLSLITIKTLKKTLSLLLVLCFFSSVWAAEKGRPLLANEAFRFSLTIKTPQKIEAVWHIAPGYYLYRERFDFNFVPKTSADIRFPQGEIRQDADRKQYEVYTGELSIPILLKTEEKTLQLRVSYQGCSSQGFCYPPTTKSISLNLHDQSIAQTPSWYALLTDQNGIHHLLSAQHTGALLLIFMGLGLLLAFTPCVLPMVPILTSLILGQQKRTSTRKAFTLSLAYVLGMAITYALAGLLAALLGSSIQVWLQKPFFIIATSGLFILLALSLFGFYDLRLPHRLHNKLIHWSNRHEGGTYAGVFIMGVLSTLIVSPCVTAPLMGVLLYMGQTGDMVLGASALFMMGMGMGIPLILIGISAGRLLPKSGPWMEAVKKIFGLMMLAMVIWMLSRVATTTMVLVLSGLWLILLALFFAMYLPQQIGWHKVNRSLGGVIAFAGLLLMAGEMPARLPLNTALPQFALPHQAFIVVHNIKDLNDELTKAHTQHKPVMLDFYADWCESCVIMDKGLFSNLEVMKALNHFVLLRADLSENTADDETLLKNFNVIAPPTVLFFNRGGQEVNSHRIVGEVNKQEFLSRLTTFFTADCDKKVRC